MVTSSSNFGAGGHDQIFYSHGGLVRTPGGYSRPVGNAAIGSAGSYAGNTGQISAHQNRDAAQATWQQMMADVQAKMDEANQANLARYGAIRGGADDMDAALGGYRGLRDRGMGYIDSLSNQQELDAMRNTQNRMGAMTQNLASSGLSGTTVKQTLGQGIQREGDAELRRIQDAKMMQRLGADQSLTGDMLRFMERREDIGPDFGMYAKMMQNYGSSRPWSMGSAGQARRDKNRRNRERRSLERQMRLAGKTSTGPALRGTFLGAGAGAQSGTNTVGGSTMGFGNLAGTMGYTGGMNEGVSGALAGFDYDGGYSAGGAGTAGMYEGYTDDYLLDI